MSAAPLLVRHPVPESLRGLVAGIVGFDETAPEGRERVQPAGSLLVLEISFTTPLEILELSAGTGAGRTHAAFLAGFMPGRARTAFSGRHAAVQVYLTPLGAYLLLGVPGRETAARVTPLEELAPDLTRNLPDQLADATSWRQRLSTVEQALLRLLRGGAPVDPLAEWAWGELQRTGGQVRIAELARRSGWSARHLASRLNEVVGVPPKVAAGVIRFERISRELGRRPLAEVAIRHGLADQSHLCREVQRYAGESPLALVRAQRPTAYTAIGAAP